MGENVGGKVGRADGICVVGLDEGMAVDGAVVDGTVVDGAVVDGFTVVGLNEGTAVDGFDVVGLNEGTAVDGFNVVGSDEDGATDGVVDWIKVTSLIKNNKNKIKFIKYVVIITMLSID